MDYCLRLGSKIPWIWTVSLRCAFKDDQDAKKRIFGARPPTVNEWRCPNARVANKDELESYSVAIEEIKDIIASAQNDRQFLNEYRIVDIIPSEHVRYLGNKLDYFSATWIQPMDTFQARYRCDCDCTVGRLSSLDRESNRDWIRMTSDWLYFFEYWKNAQVFSPDPVPSRVLLPAFDVSLRRWISSGCYICAREWCLLFVVEVIHCVIGRAVWRDGDDDWMLRED